MKTRSYFSLLFLLVACPPPKFVSAEGEVRLDATRLDFPVTLVGSSSKRTLGLTNTGREWWTTLLSIAPPFEVPPSIEVPPGSSTTLDVIFRPVGAGISAGVLHVAGQDVMLTGSGEAAPP